MPTDILARPIRPSRSRLVAAVLSLALSLAGGRASAQTDEEKAAARALATQGAEALAASKFTESLDLVSRAEQILHAPTHLLMIARSQVGLGRLVAAKETYLKLTREELAPNASPFFKRAQQEGKDELTAIDAKIASVRIAVEGGGQTRYTVQLDGQPVSPALIGVFRPVDPGKHEIAAFPVGQGPVKTNVELKDGEKRDVKLTIPDGPAQTGVPTSAIDNPDAPVKSGSPDKPLPVKHGFFTPLRGVGLGLAVVGAGGAAAGAFLLAQGFSKQSDSDAQANACTAAGFCSKPEQYAIRQLDADAASGKTVGTIVLIGGGVLLAGGITLLVIGKPKAAAPAARITPWFTGNAGGLAGEF